MAIKICKCGRCKYEWAQRGKREPKTCANCHSPYWNKERKYKIREREAMA